VPYILYGGPKINNAGQTTAQALAWNLLLDAQSDEDWDEEYINSWDSQRATHKWERNEIHTCYPSGWTPENRDRFAIRA
jgi:ferric-dicitrate binding protein FerR (iron transport regulator)